MAEPANAEPVRDPAEIRIIVRSWVVFVAALVTMFGLAIAGTIAAGIGFYQLLHSQAPNPLTFMAPIVCGVLVIVVARSAEDTIARYERRLRRRS